MSKAEASRLDRLRAGLRHAFALESPHGELTGQDRELLRRVAVAIDKRAMSPVAILFLESVRPLSYVGSQALVFLQPFLTALFSAAEYERFVAIMERREGIGALIDEIELTVNTRSAGGNE